MIPFLLDHTALLSLGAGHRQLSGLIVRTAEGRSIGQVPALCLAAAEAARSGVGEDVASLPGLEVEPVGLTAALEAGGPIGSGIDWRITHAVHLARPSAQWPGGRFVLSLRPELYRDTGIDPVNPDLI
ncbi:hypothetical protein LHJ74_00415 [Streptomyces sp. N2-109]|uniref:Uncharacterized protein n=1 Tax=Streptomyces gossypii TaxID=2883101 RepID=A0ABT2JKN4_9ACTN|nr:hypothetical protein [Streptomyces gossypii]MCT2588422.1 hypothetical protein [Streptomyces gossypii]